MKKSNPQIQTSADSLSQLNGHCFHGDGWDDWMSHLMQASPHTVIWRGGVLKDSENILQMLTRFIFCSHIHSSPFNSPPPHLWLRPAEAWIIKDMLWTENQIWGLSFIIPLFNPVFFIEKCAHCNKVQKEQRPLTTAAYVWNYRSCCYDVYVHFRYMPPWRSVKCEWNRKRCGVWQGEQCCQHDYNWHP